jgi:anti-anti-sigma factor
MLLIEQNIAARDVVLTLKGALCAPDSNRLKRAVQRAIRKDCGRLVLDLEQVTDLDASGIGGLVAARNLATKRGARIQLLRPNRRLTHMLAVTRLLPFFEVVSSSPDSHETSATAASTSRRDRSVDRI